jgi:hypothetical protein
MLEKNVLFLFCVIVFSPLSAQTNPQLLWQKIINGDTINVYQEKNHTPKITRLNSAIKTNEEIIWLNSNSNTQIITVWRDFFMIENNKCSFIGYVSENLYALVVLTYTDKKVWELTGFQTIFIVECGSCFKKMSLVDIGTMYLYESGMKKIPKIYRINQYGELEVYELNGIYPRDKAIPLPGIIGLESIEQTRSKHHEFYYQELLQKTPTPLEPPFFKKPTNPHEK